MAIGMDAIVRLVSLLDGLDPATSPLAAVRAAFPEWVISRCAAADLSGETPCRISRYYDIHLIDSREHCWRMTAVADEATGVILAQREVQS